MGGEWRTRRGPGAALSPAQLIGPQLFFMFSSPLIPPGLVLGWLALVLGAPALALGLRASRLFFCWPLAMRFSDHRPDARGRAWACWGAVSMWGGAVA